jgi:hypothetical protein
MPFCEWTGTCREERQAEGYSCNKAQGCPIKAQRTEDRHTAMAECKATGHIGKFKNPNWTPTVPWDSPSEYHCPSVVGLEMENKMFTAKDAIKMANDIETAEKEALKFYEEKLQKLNETRSSKLGKEWADDIKSIWEKAVKIAITNKQDHATLYQSYYFSEDRYIGLCSKEVQTVYNNLKELGFTAWSICENSEDFGSRSDPDYFSAGRKVAYVKIMWDTE